MQGKGEELMEWLLPRTYVVADNGATQETAVKAAKQGEQPWRI